MNEKDRKIAVVGNVQDVTRVAREIALEEAAKVAAPGIGRKLLKVPDERLRQKSRPVEKIDDYVTEVAQFLLDQLAPTESIGLAACQYGEMIRLIVVRIQGIERVFVNPALVKKSDKTHLLSEACRSIPGKKFAIERPKIVKIRGLGLDGEMHSLKGHDLVAQCLCHELDHLDGVLIDTIGRYIGE